MADAVGGPTVLRLLLGAQLRRLRESRGISAHEAARAIRGSESKISRIELGRTVGGLLRDGDLCCTLGAGDLTSLPDELMADPGW